MTTLSLSIPVRDATLAKAPAAPRTLDDLSVDDLRDLMRSVTDTTLRLQSTHVALHDQVVRLQRELADANAALRRSQALAALGEMAAGIAHEVRNPLGSIQLYVHMLAEDLAARPQQAEICGKISRAVVTLDAIVRDVLRFARETTIQPEPISSTELLQRAAHACAALMSGHDIVTLLQEEPNLPLTLDAGLMTQALANVIRNAIEAMSEHSTHSRQLRLWSQRRRVRVAGGGVAAHVVLCVQDTGPGIPRHVRDRIFNPFFTTRSTGTGLGLAIVHRIVDAHGGHIEIKDGKPRGACVELCLPGGGPNIGNPKRRRRATPSGSIVHHSLSFPSTIPPLT